MELLQSIRSLPITRVNVVRILERIIEHSLYGLVFIIPFSKAGIEIFGITAIVAWIIKTALKPSNPISFLSKCIFFTLLLLFIANLLSCITSISFYHSLRALFSKTLEYILFFLIVVEFCSNKKKMKILLWFMLVSVTLFYINGMVQYFTGLDLVRRNILSSGIRISGSMISPNDFGAYAIVFIPIFFGVTIGRNQPLKYRVVASIVLSLSFFCLFFSYSRAAWIGFIAMMLFFVFVKNRWPLLLAVLVSMISLFMLQNIIKDGVVKASVKDKIAVDYSANHRFLMAKEAVNIIIDYPLLGTGLNTYSIVGPRYKIHPRGGTYPHNSYLHRTAEVGFIGLGALFLFIWSLYSVGIRSLWVLSSKKMTGTSEYILIRGLMAGLLGLLVNAFFDTTLYALMLITTFWIISGLLIATCNIAKRENIGA